MFNRHAILSLLIVVILCFFATACDVILEDETTGGETEIKPEMNIGEMLLPVASDYLIAPVKAKDLSKFPYFGSSDENLDRNLIIYQKSTGEARLLLDKPALIAKYQILESTVNDEGTTFQGIVFSVIDEDTNENGKLDLRDRETGYYSNLTLETPTQITPENVKILKWLYDSNANSIYIKTRQEDDINIHRVNLNEPKIGTDILNDATREQLKSTTLDSF